MPAAALDVRDLQKRFGAVDALRGVTFSVEPGEVFGYLGPNGSGKTTTLRIVLGLVRESAGSARLFGKPPADPASRADIGFLPGDLRLYGDMTALATLDFLARFRPSRAPKLRDALIDELGIDAATLARRVKFLSHGTRQKLGLIAAMQHDPALLLLDEPSNGLDPLVQQAFRGIVAGFAQRGRAVLFSSHVLSEVEAVCGRVAILRRGEIVALETIERLRQKVVRKMTVRFADGAPPDLHAIAGVTRLEGNGREVTLRVQGDVNPLLRALATAHVDHIVFPDAELEDIFLGYYQGERRDA
jgi:ABC-2 type transport system ATP-binding protein